MATRRIDARNSRKIRQYIDTRRAGRYAEKTLLLHTKIISETARFIDERYDRTLLGCSEAMLRASLDRCTSFTTRKTVTSVLKAFFGFHGSEINFDKLKCRVRESDRDPVPAPHPDKVAEITALTDIKPEHRLLFLVLVDTGMRVGSAVNLQHKDFRFNIAKIKPSTAKGGKVLSMGLTPAVEQLYRDIFHGSSSQCVALVGKVFDFGESQALKIINNLGKRVDIHLAPHALRKFFACRFYHKNPDVVALQKALGHSNFSTTSNYLTRDYEDYVAAVDVSNQMA